MSGTLHIRFAKDMPAAAVEVVGPDLASIGRLWLKPGGETAIEVPSEASFLRVFLPSGRIATLEDPGNMMREITQAHIARYLPAKKQPSNYERPTNDAPERTALGTPSPPAPGGLESAPNLPSPPLRPKEKDAQAVAFVVGSDSLFKGDGERDLGPATAPATIVSLGLGHVELLDRQGNAQNLHSYENGIARFRPPSSRLPYELIFSVDGLTAKIRLPGNLERLETRASPRPGRLILEVRLATTNAVADTIGGYLNRGDLHSAATLTQTAESAEELLAEKVRDPFGAAIGAYLLLRLRRLDLMHDWTANLANGFPELADTAVIRAWHLIHAGDASREEEVRRRLREAAAGRLPIFTEGLQLLNDGLRLIGEDASLPVSLDHRSGVVDWKSPLTATVHAATGVASPPVELDVDYGELDGGAER